MQTFYVLTMFATVNKQRIMNIEQEIKQSNFRSMYQKATLNVLFTASWLQTKTNQALKEFDISSQQYNVLRILKGQYPKAVTLGLIQERMLDRMSNASRLVEKLKQKGYLKREQCEHNRRQVDITITEKGIALLEEIHPVIEEVTENYHQQLTEAEAAQLSNLLDKLRG